MLLRDMQSQFRYATDEPVATPTPTPDTEQGHNSGEPTGEKKTPTQITLTSSQLNKRLNEAKAADRKALFLSLGIEDETVLKSLIESHKAKTEADKSESQKLTERLALLEKQLQEKDARLSEAERTRRLEKRDSELKALLSKAYEPNDVLILMKSKLGDKLDTLLDESGSFDSEAAQTIVSDYQKANAHLFRDTSPGSSFSNRDGKAPNVGEDAKKALAKNVANSLKGF